MTRDIDSIRAAHARVLARRVDGEPEPEPTARIRLSRPWHDTLCSWCGKEYNRLDEGTRRDHCSDACFEADKFARETAIRNSKPAGHRKALRTKWHCKRGQRTKADMMKAAFDSRLKELLAGTEPGQLISVLDAAVVMKIKKENAAKWLERFAEEGIASDRSNGRPRIYVLDRRHERALEVLGKFAWNLGGGQEQRV